MDPCRQIPHSSNSIGWHFSFRILRSVTCPTAMTIRSARCHRDLYFQQSTPKTSWFFSCQFPNSSRFQLYIRNRSLKKYPVAIVIQQKTGCFFQTPWKTTPANPKLPRNQGSRGRCVFAFVPSGQPSSCSTAGKVLSGSLFGTKVYGFLFF